MRLFKDLPPEVRKSVGALIFNMLDQNLPPSDIRRELSSLGVQMSYKNLVTYIGRHRKEEFDGIPVFDGKVPGGFTRSGVGGRAWSAPGGLVIDPIAAEHERMVQRELIRQLTQLQRTEAKRQQYIDTIRTSLKELDPPPPIDFQEFKGEDALAHKWVIVLSDWHIGQLTPIEHTGGVYEQNLGVTEWQIERLLSSIKSIHAEGHRIDEVLLLVLGDIVEGDSMRPAQLRQIEIAVTRQALEAYRLLNYFIRCILALPGVERVTVENVGGNHDRTTARPGNAGLGETDYVDTYSWLIGGVLKESFADEPRVRITNWETFYGYTIFGGRRFVFEHGASFRTSTGSYGGIGWYPIMNAAGKYKEMLDGADFIVMGHFHVPALLPAGKSGWLVLNGALPATTHYVQSNYKGIREPSQSLLVLHESHGLIGLRPIYAVPETLLSEGEAWDLAQERVDKMWAPHD
jgi:hypothetical protein